MLFNFELFILVSVNSEELKSGVIRMEFSQAQTEALNASGSVLVMAGAGSGKTLVLTHKIGKLVREGIPAERILALTFTNKAADEMADRLARQELLGRRVERDSIGSPWIGTIHSALFKVLREDLPIVDPRYAPRIQPMDTSKSKRVIEEILKFRGYTPDSDEWDPIGILGIIAMAQTEGYWYETARHLFYHAESSPFDDLVYQIWGAYMEGKRHGDQRGNKFVDFSDMISLAVKVFRERPEVVAKWQSRFDYVLVDEFQDTDKMQVEAIQRLTEKHGNLFAVGDVRQSIYRFRGAEPSLSLNFDKAFKDGYTLYLNTNYRSGKEIVYLGNRIISYADFKVPDCDADRDGGNIDYLGQLPDDTAEAVEVARLIGQFIKNGSSPCDFVILYRTNAQSLPFEDELIKQAIPYIIKGSHGFYAREEIKDMIAYLQIVYEITDGADDQDTREAVNRLLIGQYGFNTKYGAFERVMNRPNRYLGQAFMGEWANHIRRGMHPLDALGCNYSKPYMERAAHDFEMQLMTICRLYDKSNLSALVSLMREMFKYDKWISRNFAEDTDNVKVDNLDALQSRINEYPSLPAFLNYATVAAKPENGNGKRDAVSLMTVHRCKGLEYPIVFVTGVVERVLPHARSVDIEEERRIFYVAVTRAINQVFISGFDSRFNKSHSPSRFIAELGMCE